MDKNISVGKFETYMKFYYQNSKSWIIANLQNILPPKSLRLVVPLLMIGLLVQNLLLLDF